MGWIGLLSSSTRSYVLPKNADQPNTLNMTHLTLGSSPANQAHEPLKLLSNGNPLTSSDLFCSVFLSSESAPRPLVSILVTAGE